MSGTQPRSPRISVVTPSLNQGRFLGQCLRSVLDQDYPDVEYLVVDGGSTDESVAQIRAAEGRLAWWVSEPDGGQTDAINKGFARATGAVVAWLNADDYYLPGALARVAEAYRRQPGASFYLGDGLRVDESGRALGTFFPGGAARFSLDALVYGLNHVLQPACFINRAFLAEVGPLDPSLRYGMDTDLWVRLARRAPPVVLPDLLAASREYPATKTATGSFARAEELRRIAERHSGRAMTPGALCYYLHTLFEALRQAPDLYPVELLAEVKVLWGSVAGLLAAHGAGPDGFPQADPGPAVRVAADLHRRLVAAELGCAAAREEARVCAAEAERLAGELRALKRRPVRYLFRAGARRLRRLVGGGAGKGKEATGRAGPGDAGLAVGPGPSGPAREQRPGRDAPHPHAEHRHP